MATQDFSHSHIQKQSAHLSTKMWLPILQAPLSELHHELLELSSLNPYVELGSSFEKSGNNDEEEEAVPETDRRFDRDDYQQRSGQFVESSALQDESLYELLSQQIAPPTFPTPHSQEIALRIVENLSEEGFFEGDMEEIAASFGVTAEDVEHIRQRFSLLEPPGIGAKDYKESFLFQLNSFDLDDELYELLSLMITDIEHIQNYTADKRFKEAIKVFRHLKNPPALDFSENEKQIAPDILIYFEEDGELKLSVNNRYYPDIMITPPKEKSEFAKEKLKEAKELVNLVTLRKNTVQNIGLIILQKQFRFFCGGQLAPMKLQDIADVLGYNQSTISRAVAGKYLACDRGVFALKEFFTNAVDEKVSSSEIKDFLLKTVAGEQKSRPFGDEELLALVQKRFGVKVVRRSITKYRQELNIAASAERKRLYEIER